MKIELRHDLKPRLRFPAKPGVPNQVRVYYDVVDDQGKPITCQGGRYVNRDYVMSDEECKTVGALMKVLPGYEIESNPVPGQEGMVRFCAVRAFEFPRYEQTIKSEVTL